MRRTSPRTYGKRLTEGGSADILMQYKSRGHVAQPRITVHRRVHERHPELADDDVLAAWNNGIASTSRTHKDPIEYVAIGFDGKGRLVETVAVRSSAGDWLVFHAMTPPSDNTFKELGIERS